MTPFLSEKNTNWEGAFRVPMLVHCHGKMKAGSISNGIVRHHDWLPTFLNMTWRHPSRTGPHGPLIPEIHH